MNLQEIAAKLHREHMKVVNDWLESCITKFCPEALEYVLAGDYPYASSFLEANGFRYEEENDVYTFYQGDVPLARAKFEIKLTVSP